MGPPDNVLAEAVPLNVLLTRTETLALIVTGSLVYGNGWEFTLTVLTRTSDDQWEIDPFGYHPRAGGAGTTADALRFGLQFADGRKATNLGFPFGRDDEEPSAPVLIGRGGGGGGRRFEQSFWAWPLPPPGRLEFVCEWPSQGIELTRTEVDAGPIRDAASRAQVLWPEAGGGGTISRIALGYD